MVAFDYELTGSEGRKVLRSAQRIRKWAERCEKAARVTGQIAVKIGCELANVKKKLSHGLWGQWLEAELTWSERKAQYYIAIGEKFKSAETADLGVWALATLSGKSVPEAAIEEAVRRSLSGETVTVADAKQLALEAAEPNLRRRVNRITAAHGNSASTTHLLSQYDDAAERPVEQSAAVEPAIHTEHASTNHTPQAQVPSPIRRVVKEIWTLAQSLPNENLDKVIEMLVRLKNERQPKNDVVVSEPVEADDSCQIEAAETPIEPEPRPEPRSSAHAEVINTEVPSVGGLFGFDPLDLKLPPRLNTSAFKEAWIIWAQYCVKLGEPMDEVVAQSQLKVLNRRSEKAAINAIYEAIAGRVTAIPKAKDARPPCEEFTEEQVAEFVAMAGLKYVDPAEFVDHYKMTGWTVNGRQLSDWRVAARHWNCREQKRQAEKKTPQTAKLRSSAGAKRKAIQTQLDLLDNMPGDCADT